MAWRDKIKSRVQLAYEALGNMPIAKAIGGAITNPTPQGVGESIYNLGRDVSSNLESSFGSGSTPEEMAINFSPIGAMTAYHGTPHKIVGGFDKAKIGTGEGAQAFGHGFYATEAKDIAKDYAEKLSNFDLYIDGIKTTAQDPAQQIAINNVKVMGYKAALENAIKKRYGKDIVKEIKNLEGKDIVLKRGGRIYTLDIPEPDVMLDWDKPVGKENVYKLEKALDLAQKSAPYQIDRLNITGEGLYRKLTEHFNGDATKASDYLYSLGIKGINYPAGTISGAKTDAKNFVIFNSEDIKITAEEFLDK